MNFQEGDSIEVELVIHKHYKTQENRTTWLPAKFVKYCSPSNAKVEVKTKLGVETKVWAVKRIRGAR